MSVFYFYRKIIPPSRRISNPIDLKYGEDGVRVRPALFCVFFDSNRNSNSHTNHGVVTYIWCRRSNRKNTISNSRTHNLCEIFCSTSTLVDEMWTRMCPRIVYHKIRALSTHDFFCISSPKAPRFFLGVITRGTIKPQKHGIIANDMVGDVL